VRKVRAKISIALPARRLLAAGTHVARSSEDAAHRPLRRVFDAPVDEKAPRESPELFDSSDRPTDGQPIDDRSLHFALSALEEDNQSLFSPRIHALRQRVDDLDGDPLIRSGGQAKETIRKDGL